MSLRDVLVLSDNLTMSCVPYLPWAQSKATVLLDPRPSIQSRPQGFMGVQGQLHPPGPLETCTPRIEVKHDHLPLTTKLVELDKSDTLSFRHLQNAVLVESVLEHKKHEFVNVNDTGFDSLTMKGTASVMLGRGPMGRSKLIACDWYIHSPAGRELFFSVLLHPHLRLQTLLHPRDRALSPYNNALTDHNI